MELFWEWLFNDDANRLDEDSLSLRERAISRGLWSDAQERDSSLSEEQSRVYRFPWMILSLREYHHFEPEDGMHLVMH